MAIQVDGKIVAAGGIGGPGFGVARYNSNGSLDTGFNGTGSVTTPIGLYDYPTDVAIQPDGKIVVGGWTHLKYDPFNPRAQLNQFAVVRYTTTGTLDQSFGQHGIATSISSDFSGSRGHLTIQPDGKIVVAGTGTATQPQGLPPASAGTGLVRFSSDGSLDRSFGKRGWVFTPYTFYPVVGRLLPMTWPLIRRGGWL